MRCRQNELFQAIIVNVRNIFKSSLTPIIMIILIARHGETTANVARQFHGVSDTPLTERGKDMVKHLQNIAAAEHVNRIISSPLRRCLFSAERLAQELGITFQTDDRLREISYGDWELQSHDALKGQSAWKARAKDPYHFVHPGSYQGQDGESYANQYPIVSTFFTELLEKSSPTDVVLCITHKGVWRNAYRFFGRLSPAEAYRLEPRNEEVLRLDLDESGNLTRLQVIDMTVRA